MAASEKQKEALARARAARWKNNTERLEVKSQPPVQQQNDGLVWLNALTTAMPNKQVVHVNHIEDCVPLADEVLRLYKERF